MPNQVPTQPQTAMMSRRCVLLALSSGAVALLAACGGTATTAVTSAASSGGTLSTAARLTSAASRALSQAASQVSTVSTTLSSTASRLTSTSQAPVAASTAQGQAVTLLWTSWATGPYSALTQSQADAFMKQTPGIKIDMENQPCCPPYYNKVQADIAAGTPPDVYRVDPTNYANYALKGAATVLDPLIARSGDNSFAKKMYPNVVDAAKLNGKLYGVPMGGDSCCLHINETLFKNAGVALPPTDWADPSWTWDRFIQVAAQLTKRKGATATQYGMATTYWQLSGPIGSAIVMNGGSMFDPALTTVTLDDGPAVAAMQWLADLKNKQHVYPLDTEKQAFDFAKNGSGAMYWQFGASQVQGLTEAIKGKFDYNIYPLPHVAGAPPHGYYHQSYWLIGQGTKHLAEAWQFANYLGSPAGQQPELEIGFTVPMMPGVESYYLAKYPSIRKGVISDAVKIAVPWRFPAGYTAVNTVAAKAWNAIFAGTQSANDALAAAKQAMQQALDKAKA